MGSQGQPTCQSLTNLCKFFIANHVPLIIAQKMKHTWGGDDRDSGLGLETGKHITRKKWALRYYGSVGPFNPLCVERQAGFYRSPLKMLCNSFFMV